MSKRPIIDKQLNRLRKSTRHKLPAHFDLVQWLKDRNHAQTTGEAERLILAGRVRSGSHKIGVFEVDQQQLDGSVKKVPTILTILPTDLKKDLIVLESS